MKEIIPLREFQHRTNQQIELNYKTHGCASGQCEISESAGERKREREGGREGEKAAASGLLGNRLQPRGINLIANTERSRTGLNHNPSMHKQGRRYYLTDGNIDRLVGRGRWQIEDKTLLKLCEEATRTQACETQAGAALIWNDIHHVLWLDLRHREKQPRSCGPMQWS